MDIPSRIAFIRRQIAEHQASLDTLQKELETLEAQHINIGNNREISTGPGLVNAQRPRLQTEEYSRYGRQMILPDFGLPGQVRLRASKVLIIGLGGLGCPAAAYLAGAGVGTIGLVDGDIVELSNLHRQILHSVDTVGQRKVNSAVKALTRINPHVNYKAYPDHLDPITALDIFTQYDLILDCTDTPRTRYLISDAAVFCGKPLISASALRTDGQLTVLNYPPTATIERRTKASTAGPCYRCIFSKPPPPESVTSCGEGGILGPIVGVMGVLMALETIRIIWSGSETLQKSPTRTTSAEDIQLPANHSLLMLSASGHGAPLFRTIRLKGKRFDCDVCGLDPAITEADIRDGRLDYANFCGSATRITVLAEDERITARALAQLLCDFQEGVIHEMPILVDVRPSSEFSICALPESLNIPWTALQDITAKSGDADFLVELRAHIKQKADAQVVAVCRLGNDSQLAVRKLQQLDLGLDVTHFKDITGGFKNWKRDVDPEWPDY